MRQDSNMHYYRNRYYLKVFIFCEPVHIIDEEHKNILLTVARDE